MDARNAHPSSFIPHPLRRLLVLRLSALGDVIHTIPAVTALKDAAEEITWVVEAPYKELVEIVAGVKTIPVRMKTWKRDPGAARDAIRQMRGADAAIDFQGLIKSAALARSAGARHARDEARRHDGGFDRSHETDPRGRAARASRAAAARSSGSRSAG